MIKNFIASFITGAEPQIQFYMDITDHFSSSWNDFHAVVEKNQMRMKII